MISQTGALTQAGVQLVSPEMQMLRLNKQSGYNYRYRRRFDWDENYELYRDKVIVNRLTQRQSVNLPLMKTIIRTNLKSIDDMPVLYFENLDNNKQAELFKNEYWKLTVEHNNMELQDIVDKRQEMIFGRTFDQWQIVDGWVKMTVQDPYDILVSRYCDPYNLHSSRFLIHTNIFVPLSSLRLNPDYDTTAVRDMEDYYATAQGLIRSAENQRLFIEKNQRLSDMGVQDIFNPILGETYVMLTLHFVWREADITNDGQVEDLEPQIYMYVEADQMRILMKEKLEDVIDPQKRCADHFWRYHFPYVSWADDMERLDFWSDGIGDIVRTPNKVLNSWFSQMVENRTLRNFGMNYYNSTLEGFSPQSMVPVPWGWYGVPVPTNQTLDQAFKKVDIPDLTDSLEEINFVMKIASDASGATATAQGAQQPTKVTLGEVQLMLGEAQERVKGMSKFYTKAWKDRGMMFLKLVEANPDKLDDCTIYKKGRNTSAIFKKEISPKEWMTPSGYGMKIWSQDEKKAMDTDALNKLNAVKANMPENQKLEEVYDRRLLEFADLKPDEITEVMQEEEQKRKLEAEGQGKKTSPPTETMQLPYQYVPEDVKRQYEAAFGFEPSKMAPNPIMSGQPTQPQLPANAGQPGTGSPVVPPHVAPQTPQIQPNAATPVGGQA